MNLNDYKEIFSGVHIHKTSLVHPTALFCGPVIVDRECVIGPYCIIGYPPEWKEKINEQVCGVHIKRNTRLTGHVTIDAGVGNFTTIGEFCWLLKGAHVGHDAMVGNRVTISCHAIVGGHTRIGNDCNLGLGAIIHQKQNIAEGCMIGMGAIVTKKLITEAWKTYAGNPAKYISENDKHPDYIINMKQMP